MYATVPQVVGILSRTGEVPPAPAIPTTAASLSEAQITAAIVSAQAEVDGKLTARYAVPLQDPVPTIISDITADIAQYLADLTWRQGKDYESAQDPVLLRYNRAQSLLNQIITGQIDLPPGTGGPISQPGAVFSIVQPYEGKMFTLGDFDLGVENGRVRRPY